MKKYIKVERKSFRDGCDYRSSVYTPRNGDSELFAVASVIETYGSSDILRFIMMPEEWSWQYDQCLIEKEGDVVHLYDDYDAFWEFEGDENLPPIAIVSIENIRQLALDWRVLMKKKAPEIYFIKIDDGPIVVRDSLED